MARYKITTLVDITRTQVSRFDSDRLKFSQQTNFNTLLQAINLRANIEWHSDPVRDTGSLPDPFNGKAAHWTWEFETERDDLFLRDTNPVGLLEDDINNVPIIDGLTNTAIIDPAVFKSQGEHKNIHIELL